MCGRRGAGPLALPVIQGKRILPSQEDLMFLKEPSVGNFLVKSLYKVLDGSRDVAFPHRVIWNYWVPSKVGFFLRKPPRAKF